MITLDRDIDWEELDKVQFLNQDNPEYKYFYVGDYQGHFDKEKFSGWELDMHVIRRKGKMIGCIETSINRTHNYIDNVNIFIFPGYLNMGHGVRAMKLYLEYMLAERGFRNIIFNAVKGNNRANRIYDKIKTLGGRKAGHYKNRWKLMDGNYHDVVAYELSRKNYMKATRKK